RHHDAEIIYLVGDIVDGWQLRSSWHWPQAHTTCCKSFYARCAREPELQKECAAPGVELEGRSAAASERVGASRAHGELHSRISNLGPPHSPLRPFLIWPVFLHHQRPVAQLSRCAPYTETSACRAAFCPASHPRSTRSSRVGAFLDRSSGLIGGAEA